MLAINRSPRFPHPQSSTNMTSSAQSYRRSPWHPDLKVHFKTSIATLVCTLLTYFTGFTTNSLQAVESPRATAPDGFVSLTNGKNLDGWRNPYGWGQAIVVGNEIHLTANRKFFLVTERPYTNFIFEGEILLPPGHGNSGFMFRSHVATNRVFGYQAEVDSSPRKWSGGLYDEGRRGWFISPIQNNTNNITHFRQRAGEAFKRDDWNRYRITCRGSKLKIEINDIITTDVEDAKDAQGYLGLQHHGETGLTYRFRNLRLRELAH